MMNRYHVNCPCCGHWNENLYLEETNGTFECEECKAVTHLEKFRYDELPKFEWDQMLIDHPELQGIYERHTLAHEVAHFVINRHRPAPQYHRVFDAKKNYPLSEMSEHFNLVENQADRLAAAM